MSFSSVTPTSPSSQPLPIFLPCQYRYTGPAFDSSYSKFIDSDDLLQTSWPVTHEPVTSDDEIQLQENQMLTMVLSRPLQLLLLPSGLIDHHRYHPLFKKEI